jgi:hypothetical protein
LTPSSAGHARIGGEARMELAVADVDADDVLRAALQENVGEAAGALAEVEAGHAGDVEAEARQRAVELQPAARDEAQLGVVGDLDVGSLGQVLARLGRHAPARRRAPAHAPVAISRCAADRVGAMPRSTSSWSARIASSRRPLSSGSCRACTGPSSARRCRPPARRSARSASRRPSSGAGRATFSSRCLGST